ncbi:hypothetical protein O181_035464 [Austropuccinia psidii MF-1]|uniref:Uncharacterized protein n=1 Tax=Austropuccinia psidii MF-1 TaxID=1389203 RepID=A0A9Q3D2S6_9BASI|nr:hypothetical protein [Austropuccinia psidii MF-1]
MKDGGGTEGEESVSAVSFELMAKDFPGRRIQGIRIMHSKPENFINEDGHNPVMAPQIGPQSITQDLPFSIGKGQSLMAWTLSMGPGHMGEVVVHGPPGIPA